MPESKIAFMIVKPIPIEFPTLKLSHKRVYTFENQILRVERKLLTPEEQKLQPTIPFDIVIDEPLAYHTFKTIRLSLPRQAGFLIIFGLKRGKKVILDVIRSTTDLRQEFSNPKSSKSRWNWCLDQLNTNGFSSLEFQQAKEK